MKLLELEKMYQDLLKMEDTDDGIFDFKDALLSSDREEVLNFHFNILQDNIEDYLRADLFSFFTDRENKDAVEEFLLKKYNDVFLKDSLKAEILQMLGHLRSKYAQLIATENINSKERELRYKSIIVLGWVGDNEDLSTLNHSLTNDKDPELRGYAATAMRQIWFEHSETKNAILEFLKLAISKEEEKDALIGIIITVQDLLKKKLGLKESSYGDVSGDVQKAKLKTIDALKNI